MLQIVFDNDAASLLFGDRDAEDSRYSTARIRLRREVKLGRSDVLVSIVLLNELAGKLSRDRACYHRVLRELHRLSRGRIMGG